LRRCFGAAPLIWPLSGLTSPSACSIVHEPVTSQLASYSVFVAVAYSPLPVARRCTRSTIGRRAILNQERTGRRLSKQSWGIVPKIRQVDKAMSMESQTWVIEVHPEVSFWKLNQHHPMRYRKKSQEGRSERVTLLRSICDGVDRQLERRPRGVGMDDLLDAAVSAWSALRWWQGEACPVADPERDAMGLRVAIHC
jgi:predicted RNase H-like nuclease